MRVTPFASKFGKRLFILKISGYNTHMHECTEQRVSSFIVQVARST